MATDSTNLPQGETTLDAGSDMTGSELDLTSVQLAQVEGAVELPKGNQVVLKDFAAIKIVEKRAQIVPILDALHDEAQP